MKQPIIIYSLLLLTTMSLYSQTDIKNKAYKQNYLGVSAQFYPAGIIPTINYEHFVSENASFLYRLGANITDRKDFSSEHDNEKGAGFGGSFGYRRHFLFNKGNLIIGFNTDAWNLWIDWKDNIGLANEITGTSSVFVLQPWLEAGYFFNLKSTASKIGITAGFGREINVITNGEDVAQDWIGSISIQYKFALKP